MNVDDVRDVGALERMYRAGLVRLRDMPEYWAWNNMRRRCYSSKGKDWQNYGGRGIRMCDEWLESYWAFLWDVGRRPIDGALWTIERIDNDGNYEPGNVKWDTRQAQAWNKRSNGVPGNRHAAKLNWELVREIRALRGKASQRVVADDFGVSDVTISYIWRNKVWIEDNEDVAPWNYSIHLRGENAGNAVLTEAQASEIKFLALEGQLIQQEIADLYGVSPQSVRRIRTGQTWSHVSPIEPPIPPPIPGFVRRM